MTGLEQAFERIGEAAEHHLPRSHAAGLALAVTDRHDTLGAVARGFADAAAGRPVRPDTRFQIGSISKSFASLCVLQEVRKGTIALDSSINAVLPWLELPEPFGPITVHHLLTHTSGLQIGAELGPWGMADAIAARGMPPTSPPGERFHYSNLGYKLVGLALERVTGRPIHELLLERVLGPLQMSSSFGAITEDLRADAAVGYAPIRSDRPPHLAMPLAPAVWQPSNTADGSIVSTAPDMCAYARMVLAHGDPLLEAAEFATWIGPHAASEGRLADYGYGWDVLDRDGRRVIRHTGGMVGFTALLEIWPDDDLAVVILQNGDGDKGRLGAYALACIRAAVTGEAVPAFEHPLAVDAIANADELAGTYTAEDRSIELDSTDGGIVLRTGPLAVRLERFDDEQPDLFAAPHPALDAHLFRVIREGERIVGIAHGPRLYVADGVASPSSAAVRSELCGTFRSDDPWLQVMRVYERAGTLILDDPSSGEELVLTAADDGWFAAGDPALPRRCRFLDPVEGVFQTLEYNSGRLSRSFES